MSEVAVEQPTEGDPLAELAAEEEAARVAAENGAGENEQQAPAEGEGQQTDAEQQADLILGKFKGVDDLAQAYQHTTAESTRMAQERAQLQAELDAYRNTYQPPQVQQAAPQAEGEDWIDMPLPELSEQQLTDLAYENPVALAAYMSARAVQEFAQRQEALLNQRFGPVEQSVNASSAAQTVAQLKAEYGDEVVQRNREAIADAIQKDEEFFKDPKLRYDRLRLTIDAAEFRRQRDGRHSERTPQTGQFAPAGGDPQRTAHVEGGSTGPTPPAQGSGDPIIDEMDRAVPQTDAFGVRPGLFVS